MITGTFVLSSTAMAMDDCPEGDEIMITMTNRETESVEEVTVCKTDKLSTLSNQGFQFTSLSLGGDEIDLDASFEENGIEDGARLVYEYVNVDEDIGEMNISGTCEFGRVDENTWKLKKHSNDQCPEDWLKDALHVLSMDPKLKVLDLYSKLL